MLTGVSAWCSIPPNSYTAANNHDVNKMMNRYCCKCDESINAWGIQQSYKIQATGRDGNDEWLIIAFFMFQSVVMKYLRLADRRSFRR